MAGTNEILLWAQGVGANLASQAAYAASGSRTGGVTAGVADSTLYNKAQRQSAFIAATLAQWIVDTSGGSILDNGDQANFKALMTQSVQAICTALVNLAGYATTTAMNAADANLLSLLNGEIAARASGDSGEAGVRAAADAAEAAARATGDSNIIALLAGYPPFSAFVGGSVSFGGYAKFPTNGSPTSQIIIQWGSATLTTGNGDTVAFPITFPNALGRVITNDTSANCYDTTGVPVGVGAAPNFLAYSKNQAGAYQPGTLLSFIAIGT